MKKIIYILAFLPLTGFGQNVLDGVIACYEFDEPSGDTLYDEVNGNNLQYSGATINQTGILNKAVSLDGTDDYISRTTNGNELNIADTMTTSMWIYRSGNSNVDIAGSLFSKYRYSSKAAYRIRLYDTDYTSPNRLNYQYFDAIGQNGSLSYSPASDIFTGNWVFVVMIREASTITFYINGENVASGSVGGGGSANQTTSYTYFGALEADGSVPDWFFNGLIDQTAFWDRALTETEVKGLYNNGNGVAYADWDDIEWPQQTTTNVFFWHNF